MEPEEILDTAEVYPAITPLAGDLVPVTRDTWKRLFVAELMKHGIFAKAAKDVGLRPSRVRSAMKTDSDFADYVADAIEMAAGDLEESARKRAMLDSDALMGRMLEAMIPNRYRRDVVPPPSTTFVKAYIGFSPDMWDTREGAKDEVLEPPLIELIEGEADGD